MIVFEFTLADLARTRFAVSPVWELVTSLRVLRNPEPAAQHLPWVREAMPVAAGLDLAIPFALTPPEGYIPDFLTPPPPGPVSALDDELDRMLATQPEQVRAELHTLFRGRDLPPRVAAFAEDPVAGLHELAATFRRYWDLTLRPYWPRIRALLDADLTHRAGRLTDGGPARLFADLHDGVRWAGDRLEVPTLYDGTVPLRGEGLLLMPSAFTWRPFAITSAPWQPTLVYPARGIALLWERGTAAPDALAAVLGRARAELLAALEAPASTTELAGRLGRSAGGISEHLTALRDAGLVSAARQGRSVLYVRTPVADRLVVSPAGGG
ncbi:MAG: helix-turn-helix domain-containing protein [Solirubrobacteraceae bacterium]